MAVTTGFSEPYVAKYTASGTTVTYSGGMKLGRGVSMSVEVESADDNNFYADDQIAESETGIMTSATGTFTIDGLEPEAATLILGLPEKSSETVGEDTVDVYDYDDRMSAPYVGVGVLRRVMMNGATSWEPIVFTKLKFNIPGDEAATQEDQIDWQTQDLETSIVRDDTEHHRWKRVFARQTSKAAALAIVKGYLNITDPSQAKRAAEKKEGAKNEG